MADTTSIRWIYPPNWAGAIEGVGTGFKRMCVLLLGTSDATGETDAVKVNLSDLLGNTGKPVVRTVIRKIWYEITGLTCVLEWKRNPDIPIALLNAGTVAGGAAGELDFTEGGKYSGLVDPGGEGTGDIVLTTTNAGAGDSYSIKIEFDTRES